MAPPAYNKPDQPGIWMSFDNSVALYQIVQRDETFDQAAEQAFSLIKEAQDRYPDWPRVYYLDILGHTGERAGFDGDFFEFQQEFLIQAMGPFLTALDMPLLSVLNPDPQRNDLPDAIAVQHPESTRN
ncbi:MAG: hypothetical protein AAGI08_11335 [Bacteroidota bacterium]